jgi:hypothetical protein
MVEKITKIHGRAQRQKCAAMVAPMQYQAMLISHFAQIENM